jgi:hypothetical protein
MLAPPGAVAKRVAHVESNAVLLGACWNADERAAEDVVDGHRRWLRLRSVGA